MLIFVTATGHEFTNRKALREEGAPRSVRTSYASLLNTARLARGTYIFTDFDRLGPRELQFAAELYRKVAAAGWPVANDPARVRQRYAMLRHLRAAGINGFGAYRLESGEMPERYPVFLRNECDHFGPLTDLLPDREAMLEAAGKLIAAGHPERNLIAVEYAAEPIGPDLYRRLGAFRIGDRIVPTVSAHELHWKAKRGTKGIARQSDYDEEHAHVRDNPFREALMAAFEAARIDYGRADFGLVGGRVQIYEINTNPALGDGVSDHPFPIRNESLRLARRNYVEALAAIDVPVGGPEWISLSGSSLRERAAWRLRRLRGRLKFE
ncbi:MAG: hypothetical protein IT535_12235 [Bauldia sp.]|nr:hypothetical protein [Bauldia sp.]